MINDPHPVVQAITFTLLVWIFVTSIIGSFVLISWAFGAVKHFVWLMWFCWIGG